MGYAVTHKGSYLSLPQTALHTITCKSIWAENQQDNAYPHNVVCKLIVKSV